MSTKRPPPDSPPTPAKARRSRTSSSSSSSSSSKASLPVLNTPEPAQPTTALNAALPEAVLVLSEAEREGRVRQGLDTVMLDDVAPDGKRATRGFVKAVLRVPLHHPQARVYGVFVEVERDAYIQLRRAFQEKVPVEVRGRLATRLPFLDDAYGTDLVVREEGGDRRATVVQATSSLIIDGPVVGPRERRAGG